jgi:hypothetical protein
VFDSKICRTIAQSALAFALAVTLVSCSLERAGSADAAALRRILAEDRRAHLELDAALIASHVADTLLSIDAGRVSRRARADVEASFLRYFAGARYNEWVDVHEPIVRVARRGGMAWVVRTVRADREAPGLGGRPERRRLTCAWTATYEPWGAGWVMTTVTSTFLPEPTDADHILAAAARRWGDPRRLAGLSFLRATARVRGPGGEFEVAVCSARDGRAWIRLSAGFSAGIEADRTWMLESPGAPPQDLTPELEAFVRGHEVHMNLVAPGSRYGPLHFAGNTIFAGEPALRLGGRDALGEPAEFF